MRLLEYIEIGSDRTSANQFEKSMQDLHRIGIFCT